MLSQNLWKRWFIFPILATEASIPGRPLQPTGVGTGHFRMTTANDAAIAAYHPSGHDPLRDGHTDQACHCYAL
ncbi:MAG: hypothetical protein WAT12_16800 [Candidatus Nitrotoga sp.]